jgi:hypothetical protein
MPQIVAVAAITVSAVVPILTARAVLGVIIMALRRSRGTESQPLHQETPIAMSAGNSSATASPAR